MAESLGNPQELSEVQEAVLREAFDVFDKEKEGTITNRKLYRMMRAIGENPTEAEVQDLINTVDTDGNGKIEFEEFAAVLGPQLGDKTEEEQLRGAFRVFDQDNKGHVTVQDLQKLLMLLGMDYCQEEVGHMIKLADSDMDGLVTFEDFMRVYNE